MNKLRAANSHNKTTNTESTGPIPFMKMIDTALFAVSLRYKKAVRGSCIWRTGILIFLNSSICARIRAIRTNGRRFPNTAVFISDEFMKRVQTGGIGICLIRLKLAT